MSTEEKAPNVTYYIMRTAVGAMIMKVEKADDDKFLTLYGDMIIARGLTLQEALEKTIWRELSDEDN